MTELTLAIEELKNSAYKLRLYNQRLVLIFLDKATASTCARWYSVAANAWPILIADETPNNASLSKRRCRAHRQLLDQARGKIMLALSNDIEEAEALLSEARALHDCATKLLSSGRLVGFIRTIMVLAKR